MPAYQDNEGYMRCGRHAEKPGLACPECWREAVGLDIAPHHEARSNLIKAARGMIGAPFQYHGRHGKGGVDCSGLIVCAAREAGLSTPDLGKYSKAFQGTEFVAAWTERMDGLSDAMRSPGLALPGDVVLSLHRRRIRHAELLTDAGTTIHASNTKGKVIESLLTSRRSSLIRYVLRFREWSNG